MPFNSFQYFLFLAAVYGVFRLAAERWRLPALLAASVLFYAALRAPYLPAVLALVAVSTYAFGIVLGRARADEARRALLWGGIAVNTLVLVAIKYLPFIGENLRALSSLCSIPLRVPPVEAPVSIGVSFYVFQAISYLADVYLGIAEPERNFGRFALSLAFFPKLLQGPIERAGDLLPQIAKRYEFDPESVRLGLLLFAWGLFKKVAVADSLGLYVNDVYDDPRAYTGVPLLLATYGYAFQLYMDFSGYTDMALGSARLFNVALTPNFDRPYLAPSVAEFWRRWHISFSRWIFDYIFKPLQMRWRAGGNRGTVAALLVTFLVSGIWHGASWGFVVWGLLHGAYLSCSVWYRPWQKRLHRALGLEKTRILKAWQVLVTFNLVSFAWIFFRAGSVGDAAYIVAKIPRGWGGGCGGLLLRHGKVELLETAASALLYVVLAVFVLGGRGIGAVRGRSCAVRYAVYYALTLSIFFLAQYDATQGYLYFRF